MSRLRRSGGEHGSAGKDGGAAHSRFDHRRPGGAAGVRVSSLADRLRGVLGSSVEGPPKGGPYGSGSPYENGHDPTNHRDDGTNDRRGRLQPAHGESGHAA